MIAFASATVSLRYENKLQVESVTKRERLVDWAEATMAVGYPATGEMSKVYLFAVCLPFSRMSYVETMLDTKQNIRLRAHMPAFEFFGGSTPCMVPDNTKVAGSKYPREGEIEINDAYRELVAHYDSAVMPTRLRSPRDKPSVENEVWQTSCYSLR